jgi:hypothetical protein
MVAPAVAAAVVALAAQLEPAALLDRYRPVLRYHSRERWFAQPVAPGREAGSRVYGHVAREGDETWLQYWLYYAYNAQDRGVLRTGRHEGDWELVQLRLDASGRPELATLAQHTWAEGCAWDELEREGAAPVIYVANGSHANYSRAGTHDRPFPDPNDEADGSGRRERPPLRVIDDHRPSWTAWAGRWGGSRAGIVPGEQSSPRGPRFQDGDPWRRPASFHRARARPCGSEPPGRPWAMAAAGGLALVLAAAATVALRRRRERRGRASL